MPIETVDRYEREDLKANRNKLYVFGDNMSRKGFGGQAKACRGEPNALGIPTKWLPSTSKSSYFCDNDIVKVEGDIAHAFGMIEGHLRCGGIVVWPKDGVGTGLADLPNKAPAIHKYIANRWAHLVKLYGGEA